NFQGSLLALPVLRAPDYNTKSSPDCQVLFYFFRTFFHFLFLDGFALFALSKIEQSSLLFLANML
ncbi:MAG: hypothetical protein IJW78_05525, partial [Clostridia bacterium]|nr:hypothetical protein [Clostridia bacterium]